MVPVTRSAELYLPNEAHPQAVYPFWPAGVRVNATPAEGISGKPIYVGSARYQDIPPADLKGQIAVVEASAGQNWETAAGFGAKAILVLGSPDTTNVELHWHDLMVPVNLPRFYVPPGQLADMLRSGKVTEPVTLKASVSWERKTAVNLYALIQRNSLPSNGGKDKNPPGSLMISVPLDASGLVPDLAYGASQAVQTAAGLALVREYSKHPPERPVVVFFSGADSISMLGTRNMFLALSDLPSNWETELSDLAVRQKKITTDAARLKQVADDPTKLNATADRETIDRVVAIIESDIAMEQDELFRLRRSSSLTRTQKKRQGELATRQVLLNQLRYCFMQQPKDLKDELAIPAKDYVRRAIEQIDGSADKAGLLDQWAQRAHELKERVELYHWLANRLGITRSADDRSNDKRLIELLVALDLTGGGSRCGPMFWGRFLSLTNISQIQNYRDWFSRQEREYQSRSADAAWWRSIQGTIDFESLTGSRSPASWLCAPMAIGSELCQAWGVPGFSMITLDDLRLRRDTPTDTLDHLNVRAILPQLDAVGTLFRHACNDPSFKGEPDLKWQHATITGQVVTSAPGNPVPDLPMPGYFVTYWSVPDMTSKIPKIKPLPWMMGVRRNEVIDTDAEGNYLIEGIAKMGDPELAWAMAVEAFKVRPKTGKIVGCTDLGDQAADIKFYVDLKGALEPWRCVVFPCEEASLSGVYDPRFLQSLGELILLNARTNATPQRYNAILYDRMFAGFVEPGSRDDYLFRYGRVGNRLILINMAGQAARGDTDPRNDGRGYTCEELRHIGPLALATSEDFWRLNQKRLSEYRKAGVFSSLIDTLHSSAKQQIADAQSADRANNGEEMMKAANGAWANSARVYSASQDMANDVIRGAIFLLLLCVPFAFCIERLVIGTPNIYRQIAGAFAIFVIMTIALWSFHPAFKISTSPLIIVLAFAIIFMSLVVIFVVYSKFDTELKRLSSGRGPAEGGGAAEGTSFARASVITSAVLLGIANMRRRKFRTILTSITIVLITFAVLCFTSATRYLDTTTLPTGIASSYPGLMLRQRGWRPMPQQSVDTLRPLVDSKQIVQSWWVETFDPKDQINVVANHTGQKAQVFSAHAILGLSPGQSELSPEIAQVIGPKKFARLEGGEEKIVFLSKTIADELGVHEGDHVRIGGISVEVASVFDGDAFDQKVTTLSGEPLAPLKYEAGQLDAGGRAMTDLNVESFDLDSSSAGSELGAVYEHLSSTQFVIVPAKLARLFPTATLRSVAVRQRLERSARRRMRS